MGDSNVDEEARRLTPSTLSVRLWCRYDPRSAGGIEAFVRELEPRIRALRPAWDVAATFAFRTPNRLERVPLLGDLIAAALLAACTKRTAIVLANGAEYAWPRALTRESRRKTIVVWHGTRAAEIPALVARMSFAVRVYRTLEIALQRIAFVFPRQIAVGHDVPSELARTYLRGSDVRVVVNGAPAVADTMRRPDPNVVLWIGTSPHKKGLDLALEACRIVRQRRPSLRLRLVGLERGDPGIPDDPWIEPVGRIPHDAMLAEYARAAVLLATTRYEACSMAILEAMALAVPIVGSPTLAWMLGNDGGAMTDLDAAQFAEAIVRVLVDPAEAERAGERLRARANDFDWDRASRAYVEEIEALAGRDALPETSPSDVTARR